LPLIDVNDVDTNQQVSSFSIQRSQPEGNYVEVNSTDLEQLPLVEDKTDILLDVMPLDTTSLTPVAKLQNYLQTCCDKHPEIKIFVNLAEAELARLEQHAQTFPDVAGLRCLYVEIKRGHQPAEDDIYTTRALAALRELELLDELGRAKIGVKRDPYTSETLVTGLLEQYRLRRFVQAYKHLDDAGFAQAFQTLILDAST
jgi:hypothetical protein